ncbi:MAG: radical SAM protein [Bacillota bacterium]
MALSKITHEQGPIRPPNEANSLLLRFTRNCPWNWCQFCPVYKKEKFSRRSLQEIKRDINSIDEAVSRLKDISDQHGMGGAINRDLLAMVHARYPELLAVALWQYHRGETVFLQDADSILLPVAQLKEILELLKEKFPEIKRITTYARSRSILRRSIEELKLLKQAGLSRVHVGLESGNDQVLDFMKKGVNGSQQIEAGIRIKEAGLTLSEYVILGLGGRDLWREHAVDTARVLNEINPDYIRVRTLAIHPVSPLYESLKQGQFKPHDGDGVIREEALLLEKLDDIDSAFYSDHILNLLEEVNGRFPGDKERMKAVVNRYLSMPDDKRELFRLGRRTGYLRKLRDMNNSSLLTAVEKIYKQLKNNGISVDQYIEDLMRRYI